jgi:hypothetical protein
VCVSAKRNQESEWKPGARKENRSTKVQVQKGQESGSVNAKVQNLGPKKSAKAPAPKVLPGIAETKAQKKCVPISCNNFIISKLIHKIVHM